MPDQPEVEELPDETEAPAGELAPEKATDRILWLLRHRHTGRRKEEWALFTELRSAVGFGPARYLDLLALGTWKSSGYRAIAYEVKVSRADFAKELANPEKRAFAESIAEECYFATPAGLLRPDEVPEGWGLIVAQANGLKVVKRPTQRAPRPWPREFVCAMARRAADPPIPPVPGKLWTFGGRELDLEDVQALCRDLLPQEIGRQVSEKMAAWKKVAQQELSYDESHYRALIAHEMGVKPVGLTMWAARRWIHNLANGGGGPVSAETRRSLEQARDAINRALQNTQPMPDPDAPPPGGGGTHD